MKTMIFILASFLLAIAAVAQTSSVTIRAARSQFSGEHVTVDGVSGPVAAGVKTRAGYGIALTHSWSPRFSTALGVDRLRGSASSTIDDTPIGLGTLSLTPVTAIATLHLAPSAVVDPYLGAGAAWVSSSKLRSADTDQMTGTVSLSSDFTYVLNAGLAVPVGSSLQVSFDIRYMPVNVAATAAFFTENRARFKFNNTLMAIGAGWRF